MQDKRIGTILQGRYRVLERIAHGGMGVVYKGERVQLERPVAVKFLHPWIASDESARRRFETEMRAMSRLHHPNCVSVIDFGVDDSPYLVMDYVVGRTLRDLLGDGPLPPGRALHIVRQILAGLAHAHGQSILHRDVKPENVVLAETTGFGDQVRILDFGLAKLVGSGSNPTTGLPLGTPHYMSPEQTRAEPLDARTDLYSVGIILQELLTGRRPFNADEVFAVIRMQREDAPPPLGPGFSPELQAVVSKALAKAPTARFHSAKELAAALDATPEASQRPQTPGALEVPPAAAAEVVAASLAPTQAAPIVRAAGAAAASARASRRALYVLGGLSAAVLAVTIVTIATRDGVPSPAAAPAHKSAPRPAPEPRAEPAADVEVGAPRVVPKPRAPEPNGEPRAAAAAALEEGHRYFAKNWWSAGMDEYRRAIAEDARVRGDERMNRELLRGLSSFGSHRKIADFIVEDVGPPAVPFVRDAVATWKNKTLRARAEAVLRRLERQP